MMCVKHGSYAISKKIGVKWPLNIDFSKCFHSWKMFKWWCNFCKSYICFLFLKMETWPTHIQNRHFTLIFYRNCVWANFNINILICCSWDLRLLILCLRAGNLTRPVPFILDINLLWKPLDKKMVTFLIYKPVVTIKTSLTWSKLYSDSGQRKLWSIKLWKTF
jgi:hypothetical protein